MGTVQIDPQSKNWPYLEEGKYGPGMDVEAEVEIMGYECPTDDNPAYDKDGERGPYVYLEIQVRPADPSKALVTLRHHESIAPNSGSRILGWLENIGIGVADDGTHDDEAVPGTKCGVEMAEPRSGQDGKKFSKLKDVFGI